MSNVDKDVAAMLQSLKKYDILAESIIPKKEQLNEEDDSQENKWPDFSKKDDKKSNVKKTPTGYKHEKNYDAKDEKDDEELDENINEGVDPEILEWMERFQKLGKMTGYGR